MGGWGKGRGQPEYYCTHCEAQEGWVGGVKGGASLSTNVHTASPIHGWEVQKARCEHYLGTQSSIGAESLP